MEGILEAHTNRKKEYQRGHPIEKLENLEKLSKLDSITMSQKIPKKLERRQETKQS